MNSEPDTFAAPFVAGSETSQAAAEGLSRTRAATQRQRVFAYLAEHGPACDEQIQIALGLNPNTQRPRRIELVNAGWLRNSGLKVLTRAGFAAVAWVVAK